MIKEKIKEKLIKIAADLALGIQCFTTHITLKIKKNSPIKLQNVLTEFSMAKLAYGSKIV
jgi:hypothetical protein